MTVRALAGLVVLNVIFLVCGAAVLWLVRGWRTWVEFLRLAGLAYLAGVAAACGAWTLLLVVGIPFSSLLVLLTLVAFVLAGVLGGRSLERRRPPLGSLAYMPDVVVGALGIAAAGLLLEVFFRASRLAGLYNWDAWSFWVPKAKAIYFFGGLDEQFFTTLPGAAYPPLLPTLDAATFHAMGSPDVVTLHVQFWFLGLGFVWALAGLLSERVPAWMLWPFVLVLLVAPRIGRRFAVPEADLLLDFFFVAAALLIAFWLLDRKRWRLVLATVFLCGMVLTKREGVLLAAILVAATLLASVRTWRATWPSVGLAGAAVIAVGVPWRIWYIAHGVAGEGSAGTGVDLTVNVGRAWASLRLAVDVLFSSQYWSVIVAVAIGALVIAALAREALLVVFFGSLVVLVTLGGAWVTWAIPKLPITQDLGGNPIVRYMGSAALLAVAASPILLSAAWPGTTGPRMREGASTRGRRAIAAAAAVVLVPLLAYPMVMLAKGRPRFPSSAECARHAVEGQPADVVFGRLDDPESAAGLRDRVVAFGFKGTETLADGCGRWKVVLSTVPSVEVGREIQSEAGTVGLHPTLELAATG